MGWLVPDLQICCSCCGSGLESDPVLGTKALSGDVSRCCLCHLSPASPHRLQPHSRRASQPSPRHPSRAPWATWAASLSPWATSPTACR